MNRHFRWMAWVGALLALTLTAQWAGASQHIRIVVNGQEVVSDVPAQIISGRTMVPIRFISEAFGAKVGWEAETRTVSVQLAMEAGDAALQAQLEAARAAAAEAEKTLADERARHEAAMNAIRNLKGIADLDGDGIPDLITAAQAHVELLRAIDAARAAETAAVIDALDPDDDGDGLPDDRLLSHPGRLLDAQDQPVSGVWVVTGWWGHCDSAACRSGGTRCADGTCYYAEATQTGPGGYFAFFDVFTELAAQPAGAADDSIEFLAFAQDHNSSRSNKSSSKSPDKSTPLLMRAAPAEGPLPELVSVEFTEKTPGTISVQGVLRDDSGSLRRTFVVPHVLETSGRVQVTAAELTFSEGDGTLYTFSGSLPGRLVDGASPVLLAMNGNGSRVLNPAARAEFELAVPEGTDSLRLELTAAAEVAWDDGFLVLDTAGNRAASACTVSGSGTSVLHISACSPALRAGDLVRVTVLTGPPGMARLSKVDAGRAGAAPETLVPASADLMKWGPRP